MDDFSSVEISHALLWRNPTGEVTARKEKGKVERIEETVQGYIIENSGKKKHHFLSFCMANGSADAASQLNENWFRSGLGKEFDLPDVSSPWLTEIFQFQCHKAHFWGPSVLLGSTSFPVDGSLFIDALAQSGGWNWCNAFNTAQGLPDGFERGADEERANLELGSL